MFARMLHAALASCSCLTLQPKRGDFGDQTQSFVPVWKRCFPGSASVTHHPASRSSITAGLWLCSISPSAPPPTLSFPFPFHHLGDVSTPILPWPNPCTPPVLPYLLFLTLSIKHCFITAPPSLSLSPPPSLSGDTSAVLCCDIEAAFIRFIKCRGGGAFFFSCTQRGSGRCACVSASHWCMRAGSEAGNKRGGKDTRQLWVTASSQEENDAVTCCCT